MNIINWNVGRPPKSKCAGILEELSQRNGDIIVLTETNTHIEMPSDYHHIATLPLPLQHDGIQYNTGEIRTSIWTKYPLINTHKTFDEFTSICSEIETPLGLLTVYATIIGVFGGKGSRFRDDLTGHLSDFDTILSGKNACIIGDYNTTFSGYAYPSHEARASLDKVFKKFNLINLTGGIPGCVDHISISNGLLQNKKVVIDTWNTDKKLSDHIGTSVTIFD